MQELTLDSRFNGPPDSANGGYTCGRLASLLEGNCAQVTLRLPPPLDQAMQVRPGEEGGLELYAGDTLVAQASPASLDLEVPEPPDFARAQELSKTYVGHQHHPFPTCFVCGPKRDDGLAIFAGARGEQVAAGWTPALELADENGFVRPEFMWCALDCPGAFAVDQNMENPRVLGRLVASIERPLKAGRPAVVLGWPLGLERRKAFAGTAVFDEDGQLCARARAVWIALS